MQLLTRPRSLQSNALADGNALELRRLVSLWDLSSTDDWETKHSEELMLFGALLAGGTGRRGRQTNVDFFLVCPAPFPSNRS